MTASPPASSPRFGRAAAIALVAGGVVGWVAAFALTLERFSQLTNPSEPLSCDFSVVVQCGANLTSAQGAVLGFPNPIIGLTGWVVPIVLGVVLLAGARLPRWLFAATAAGMAGAMAFVVWLISQSIFVLGTLCPWCMVTWAAVIPLFLLTVLVAVRERAIPLGARAAGVAGSLVGWVPLLSFAGYLAIAVIAQLRLDVMATL